MKQAIFFISLLCTSTLLAQKTAADYTDDYRAYVEQLRTGISSKSFEKTWKEEESNWDGSLKAANTASEMAKALGNLPAHLKADKAFEASWPGKKAKWEKKVAEVKDWEHLGAVLVEFETHLKNDAMGKEWADKVKGWKDNLEGSTEEFVTQVKAPPLKINETIFGEQFHNIFRTSISGLDIHKKAGTEHATEEAGYEVKTWNTDVLLSGASGSLIKYHKKYEVASYIATYRAGTSMDNAWKVMDKLVALIEKEIPEGFKNKRTTSKEYAGNKVHTFEFDTDEFRITMKRPEIRLGILEKDGNLVVVVIIKEPYYKNQYKY